MSIRPVKRIEAATPTLEGAGMRLHRAFGFGDTSEPDPILPCDDFRNEIPAHCAKGFPWRPHSGIEAITYVLAGEVEHGDSLGDSLGDRGTLGARHVQWMTAGRAIMHQEMPNGDAQGRMHGFQLWANLPSALKMSAPRDQDTPGSRIAERIDDDGTLARAICGDRRGIRGPADGIAADPRHLDVSIPRASKSA
jgi:hypothetical protein